MKKIIVISLYIAGYLAMPVSSAEAATDTDIDKLTTYTVIIGRAVACGVDIKPAMKDVGRWMDRRFPPGSLDQQTYLPIFSLGVQYHAKQQANGNSPDSCSSVRKKFSRMEWP